ncbi:MAG: PrgI family protein [Candidatus Saccharibacteria bacterium]
MAVYKVPQDVEADDKLIGPFSFRQFIYLIIVALSGALAWGLAQLFVPLAIIPMPIIVFFGALALPLRKDQPMEIYMAAMASFFLKPHLRKWDPDGIESLIEVTVPKTVEVNRAKDISQGEAQKRFSYLAEVVDSQGWAVRAGVQSPTSSAMNTDAYMEAQNTEDILDVDTFAAQTLNDRLDESDARHRQELMDQMQEQIATVTEDPQPVTPPTNQAPDDPNVDLSYNPYPNQIQQSVIEPIGDMADNGTKPDLNTSEKPLSAGIINLANSSDLSIATIASQANRINEQQSKNEEVYISLR